MGLLSRSLQWSCIRALFLMIVVSMGLGATPVLAAAVNFVEAIKGDSNLTTLTNVSDVAISADGKFVYAAAYTQSAITVFERNSVTGALIFRSAIKNNVNGITGIAQVFSIASTSDNKSVYIASPGSGVTALSRDETTGALTVVNTVAASVGGMTLQGFVSVSVSPDGKAVYGVSGSGAAKGLAVFTRNTSTGAITFLEQHVDGNGNALNQYFAPATSPIKNIALTADGRFLYVTSTASNAVSVFQRDLMTERLTLVSTYVDQDNIASSTMPAGTPGVDGLTGASSLVLSPDGNHLYVSGQGKNSVAIFAVNPTTGVLSYLNKLTQGVNGISSLAGARSLGVSPDGKFIYSSAITSNAVTAFDRNSSTGLLTVNTVVVDDQGGVDGLKTASGMSTDPLNRHLYVAGQGEESVAVFSLPTPAVVLSSLTASTIVNGAAVLLDDQLDVYDSDSANLVSATVSISEGFISTDLLAITPQGGITPSYNAVTGVLSLIGSASLDDYKTILRSLTYQAGDDPGLSGGQSSFRKITVVLSDGDNASAPVSVSVSVSKPASSTVTFNDWNGAVLKTEQVQLGGGATAPAQPARIGYTFTGWSSSFDNVTADITVTAQYSINTHTVTFDLNGGTSAGSLVQTVNYGQAATAPVVTAPAGKTFTGWSSSFDNVTADITVTAQYSINTLTVTFDLNGGTGTGSLMQTVNYGQTATAPVVTAPAGKTFAGWSSSFDNVTANVTVTAQYSINTHTVTFDLNGGTGTGSLMQTVNYGQTATAPVVTAPAGKTFAGWSSSFDNVTANVTVTAQYSINTHTVTFDLNGGTGTGSLVQTVNYGQAATAPVVAAPAGKTFTGWSSSFDNVTADVTVTAQYSINTHTVTFDLNGGTGTGSLMQTVNYGQTATAPVVTAPAGKTFTGWSGSFDNVTADVNITAQYSVNTYAVAVTVAGNGSVSPSSQQVASGASAAFVLSRTNASDYAAITSNCNAAVLGNQILVPVVSADCTISVGVFPSVVLEKESDTALASNTIGRFTLTGGTGEQSLVDVRLRRAGAESLLEQAEGKALVTKHADGSYLFSASRTGRYTLQFADQASNEKVAVSFDVLPYVAFTSSKQPVQADVATTLRIWLSDEPIDYPVSVGFVTTGVSVSVAQLELNADDHLRRAYTITATDAIANVSLVDQPVVNALIGTPAVHTLAVQTALPALSLSITATQQAKVSSVVTTSGGDVTLNITERDNVDAVYSWTAERLSLNTDGASASFNPNAVVAGVYSVKVTGTAVNGRSGEYALSLRVIADCPVANCDSAGLSLVPDVANPFVQTPNRLSICPGVNTDNRVNSCQEVDVGALYAEVPNQYTLTLGKYSDEQSWETGQFGIALNDGSLSDTGHTRFGNLLNFDVMGLDNPGEAVPVAISLPASISIPKNAVWRKFINEKWQNFASNDDNKIHSAARDALGQCPGVSSSVWAEGLVEGHSCIRLTIEDGGANDNDGVANGVIRDPGVLAVAVTPEPPVVVPPVKPPVVVPPVKDASVKSGGGSMGGLGLLLMGLFVVLRSRKFWAAVVLLPLPAMAQDVYVGLDGVSAKTSVSSVDVTEELNGAGITGTAYVDSSSRNGWRLYGGVQLSKAFAVELGWLDAGDITTHFGGIPAATTPGQLARFSPQSGEGLELSARVQLTDSFERIKPSLRAGVWAMDFKDHYIDSNGVNPVSNHDYVPFVGADIRFLLAGQWSLKLGGSRYYTEHYDTTTFNLGLVYGF